MVHWNLVCGWAIFACYLLIGVGLIGMYDALRTRGAHSIRSPGAGALLGMMFIVSCGVGHLASDVMMFDFPAYRLELLAKANTALWSVATVLWLFWSTTPKKK